MLNNLKYAKELISDKLLEGAIKINSSLDSLDSLAQDPVQNVSDFSNGNAHWYLAGGLLCAGVILLGAGNDIKYTRPKGKKVLDSLGYLALSGALVSGLLLS